MIFILILMNAKGVCLNCRIATITTNYSKDSIFYIVDTDTLLVSKLDYNTILTLVDSGLIYNLAIISGDLYATSYSIGLTENLCFYNNTIKYRLHLLNCGEYFSLTINSKVNKVSFEKYDKCAFHILHNNKIICDLITDWNSNKLYIRMLYMYKEYDYFVVVVSMLPDISERIHIIKVVYDSRGSLVTSFPFDSDDKSFKFYNISENKVLAGKFALLCTRNVLY